MHAYSHTYIHAYHTDAQGLRFPNQPRTMPARAPPHKSSALGLSGLHARPRGLHTHRISQAHLAAVALTDVHATCTHAHGGAHRACAVSASSLPVGLHARPRGLRAPTRPARTPTVVPSVPAPCLPLICPPSSTYANAACTHAHTACTHAHGGAQHSCAVPASYLPGGLHSRAQCHVAR